MTSQPAHDTSRHADGRFAPVGLAEVEVELDLSSEFDAHNYLPDDFAQVPGFADFCRSCGGSLFAGGACATCGG